MVFDNATKARVENLENQNFGIIPNGLYHLTAKRKGFGEVNGTLKVEDGMFILLKGSTCPPTDYYRIIDLRKTANIVNNILVEDFVCPSVSTAATLVRGSSSNGWECWKTSDGEYINIFRKK